MAKTVKDVLEATETKEGTKGFVTALLIVVVVLTTVEFLGAIEFRSAREKTWVSPDSTRHVLGFPSYDNAEYKLYIKSVGEYAGSVVLTAEKRDGWSFQGTFYRDDTVLIGNQRVTIKDINMDREKPILLEYYSLLDLKALLIIFLIVLAVATYYYWKL
jgi:hypothetical protein